MRRLPPPLRICILLAILVIVLPLGGCLQSSSIIRVNGDGSGTIEHHIEISATALAQLRQLEALTSKARPMDPLSDEQMRDLATAMGPGVTFVSSKATQSATGEGRVVMYTFSDINQLRVSQQPQGSGGGSGTSGAANAQHPEALFVMTRQPNGNALLRVTVPPPRLPGSATTAAGPAQSAMSPERMAMMKQMYAGMRVSIAVEPVGRLVSTNSPFVDGQRVTLLDLDFDQLLKDEGAIARLQGLRSVEETKAALKDIPGLKVWLEKEITIEFTPASSF